MKRHMPGFVPVNYKQAGKILLVLGAACLILKVLAYFTKWFALPNTIFYLGIGLVLLSLYLIFIVPKE